MVSEREAADPLAQAADPFALSRGIFEHSPVPYAVFARDGTFVLANPAYRTMFGRYPPNEYNVLEDEIAARSGLTSLVRRAFDGETVTTPTVWYDPSELEHVQVNDAKRVAMSCTFFPLRNARGQVREVAIAYKEVTNELLALERAEAGESEAKKLSREAEAHAALHSAIVQHMGDGLLVADADSVLRIINPAAERQHGVRVEDVPAPEWSRTFGLHTLDRKPLPLEQTPLYRAGQGERVEDARWLVHRADGAWRVLAGTATPLLRADGTRAGAVLISRDETERLELEEQLRAALHELRRERETLLRTESEFRAMFELAGVGMAQADPHTGRFLRVNQRLCELTGYGAAELLEMSLFDLTDASQRAADRALFQQMIRNEEPIYRSEARCLRKQGELLWLQVTATVTRDAEGRPERAMAVLVDVSERKRVEEQTMAISDNATVGLFMLDQHQHCVFMNPAAEQITGFRADEVQGNPLHFFVHHTRPDGTPYPIEECPIDRAFPERRQVQGEDVFVHKDGRFYPVAFTASPLRNAVGVPRGTVIELRDTSEEKRAQAERDRLLSELEQAVRVRDEFLSIAGHEIRSPLTALLLNLQALTLGSSDDELANSPKLKPRLSRAVDNAERLQRLIEELLDVSRIVSSQLRLEPEELDLFALVQQVVERLSEHAAKLGGRLRMRGGATMRGHWDRFRLEQVVSNLLTNALKYGAGHPVDITLTEEHGVALLSVADQGIGIAAEDHSRIFERFERAVSSRHYGGLGLGLWIARQVVEASGGTITVESAPGRGSRFLVRLPLRHASTAAAAAALD
jgi:PAS domain S-box-containing protein